jgi:cytochrome c553
VGKPAIDGRFDKIRRKESKRDCHVDFSRAAAATGNRGDQSRPRLRTYRASLFGADPLGQKNFPTPSCRCLPLSHSLSLSMVTALAANFNALNPPPLGGAPRQLGATGEKIFQDGLPDSDIAACAACHGPDATGSGQIPRLAGQLYPYMIKELTNWGKERGQNPAKPDISAVMSPVAHSLNKQQIEAVTAYAST